LVIAPGPFGLEAYQVFVMCLDIVAVNRVIQLLARDQVEVRGGIEMAVRDGCSRADVWSAEGDTAAARHGKVVIEKIAAPEELDALGLLTGQAVDQIGVHGAGDPPAGKVRDRKDQIEIGALVGVRHGEDWLPEVI